jgi:carbamoyl-phosphate synthase large subunit
MGIDADFGRAYAKAQRAAGMDLPLSGTVLVSVRDADKDEVSDAVRELAAEGFAIVATDGTAKALKNRGIDASPIHKVKDGSPHTVDLIRGGAAQLVISTTDTSNPRAVQDSASMRRAALEQGVPYFTTVAGARAAASAIRALRAGRLQPVALQDLARPEPCRASGA